MKSVKYLLAMLIVATAVFLFPLISEAAANVSITDGAGIRTEGDQGIRFKIKVTDPEAADDYGIKLSYVKDETTYTKTVSKLEGFNKIYAQGGEGTDAWIEYTAVIVGLDS
ncbi:MAG: hypothetical protein LBR68_03070, partial [Lachnoclostridium sp.]|nr:hypothetical protein [Lachnoclostridium sp.]